MDRAEKRRQQKLAGKAASDEKLEKANQRLLERQARAIHETLRQAQGLHTAGRLPEAESLYQRVLQTEPYQPVALHLLGVIAHQVGKAEMAIGLMTQALAVKPDYADAHSNLGNVLRGQGRLEEAVESCQKALAVAPGHAEAQVNLGLALHDMGRLEEAVECCLAALAARPDYAEAHSNLGNAYQELGRLDEAVASYHKALAIAPDYAGAHFNLGNALKQRQRLEDAVASYQKAIALAPGYVGAYSNLGLALHDLGRLDEAVESYRQALSLNPDYADAHVNLGNAYQALERLEEANASYHAALAINPDLAAAHYNLGNTLLAQHRPEAAVARYSTALSLAPEYPEALISLGLAEQELGRLEEALACYVKALDVDPEYPEAHYNLGLLRLLRGEFEDGWRHYAWRWQVKAAALRPRAYEQPFWDGGALAGKTIFVYPEQGVGDTIQFARYLVLLEARGARVIFEAPEILQRLFEGGRYAPYLAQPGENPPTFDCHAPLLDLPRLLNTGLESIPDCDTHLLAPPDLEAPWTARIRPAESQRLGIVWAGNPKHLNDFNRSLEASLLLPLTTMAGVSVYSLQVGRDGEAARVFGDRVTDLASDLSDFAETAAAISNLDLIVTVDTAVAHLAGALCKPVWTLLPFVADWRWLLRREDSPWYPTMRLFRQTERGDWRGVIERVRGALLE